MPRTIISYLSLLPIFAEEKFVSVRKLFACINIDRHITFGGRKKAEVKSASKTSDSLIYEIIDLEKTLLSPISFFKLVLRLFTQQR